MKDPLYYVIENETKSAILKYVVFLIIFIIIFHQIYSLTRFMYNYELYYDYGHMLKETCNNAYIEYETERFQIANNLINIKIDNDKFSTQFNAIILLLTIIVSLMVSYFFVYIFIRTVFENSARVFVKFALTLAGSASILSIPSVIGSFLSDSIIEFFANNNITIIVVTLLKIGLTAYLALMIPLFLIIKLNTNIDISPFATEASKLVPHILLLSSVFIAIFNKDIHISYLSFMLFFALYIISYFIVVAMTEIYIKENETYNETNKYDLSENDDLKTMAFTQTYFADDDIDQTNETMDTNITSKFVKDVFGLNDVSISLTSDIKYHEMPVNISSFKSIIFFLGVVLLCLYAIYTILQIKENGFSLSHIFHEDELDRDALYSFAFIPFLCLYLVLFVVILCKEYNTLINKNILYKPHSLYKQKLFQINDIFNELLENDKATVTNNSVCKNIVNAIHMTIYSNLFKGHKGDPFIIPELLYVDKCTNDDHIGYDILEEYDIEYYINGRDTTMTNNANIFYNNARCTSVNNDILLLVMKNIVPSYGDTLKETDIELLKINLIKQLKFAIVNIINKKTYAGDKSLELTNDFISNNYITPLQPSNNIEQQIIDSDTVDIIEFIANEYIIYIRRLYEYTIKTVQALCKCNNIEDFTTKGYAVFLSKIDNTIQNTTNGAYSLNIKKDYINKFTILSKIFFKTINTRMSFKTKITENNYKLTKYVIHNYNIYNNDVTYKFNNYKLTELSTKNTDTFINKGIFKYDDISEIQQTIITLNANVQTLNALFKNSDSIDINSSNTSNYNRNIVIDKNTLTSFFKDTTRSNLEKIGDILLSIKTLMDKLGQLKHNYKDLFKAKYYYDNDYNKQLIYDYKMKYIDDHIVLHNDVYTTAIKIKSSNEVFDYENYRLKYIEINTTYENKYDALYDLSHDAYKNYTQKFQDSDLTDADVYSKNLLLSASNTSSSIYAFVILYIIALITANFIS